MSVFLCGNTGIVNRGCEAIVRSSVKLLEKKNRSIYLASDNYDEDRDLAKELGINFIPYDKAGVLQRASAKAIRTVYKKSLSIHKVLQAHLLHDIKEGDVCLNIGGDVYCYGRPTRELALNRYASKRGAKTILWCCSIEKDVIKDDVITDLNTYDRIFVRESLSQKNLIDKGIDKNKIVKVCDPAFFLEPKEAELPQIFNRGEVVGINVSELVIKDGDETVYNAVIGLINYILEETDLNICLIPHVYSIEKNLCDWPKLSMIRQQIDSDRIALIDRELNCEELKYIISKCRFLFAARTHASVAAYSSLVPTVVLGYSVKSKGLAKDLFGDYKDYVIPYNEINGKECLIEALQMLMANEQNIRQRLNEVLPEYKNQLTEAIRLYITERDPDEEVCDRNLCTGCMACRQVCPHGAITVTKDEYGFHYPQINTIKCKECDRCRNICPALNKRKDDLKRPLCYGAFNTNEKVRKESSSGGIFYLIAREILNRGGLVFGAAFDESNNVHHIGIDDIKEIEKLQRSKYVQSEIGNTYEQAKAALEKNKPVLFTGTPCQIEGLKAFLNKEYTSLYTQDIICHGVPSPRAWQEYLDHLHGMTGSEVDTVTFRDKEKGWSNGSIQIAFSDGTEKHLLAEDPYYKGFMNHFYLRQSCYECSFRKYHRVSDITLADFWGIDRIDSEMFDDKGTSLIMIHSEKGKELFESVRAGLMAKEYAFEEAVSHNPSYLSSGTPSPFAKNFLKMWNRKGLVRALDHFNGLADHKLRYLYERMNNWSWKN